MKMIKSDPHLSLSFTFLFLFKFIFSPHISLHQNHLFQILPKLRKSYQLGFCFSRVSLKSFHLSLVSVSIVSPCSSPKCINLLDEFWANIMGCISSKNVVKFSVSLGSSSLKNHDYDHNHHINRPLKKIKNGIQEDDRISWDNDNQVVKDKQEDDEFSINMKFGRLTEAEHVAAGWPSWLSAVAGEAIDGWLPLKSGSFERFEKIGQGTYSSVYRARNMDSGKMVALKKVRFDNLKPDSVKFMSREITILRTLDHQNIMKLEGIITSQLSCNIYLVFEYMEHDLHGLLSNPDINFNDSQIKCYMRQLVKGIEHCHSLGILHRDIKTANILVNNEGILKIGDFGLAKFYSSKSKEPLTSHVVTLWYRPPELLLGCTKYGPSVDLWSVGCVFAELFLRKPIIKGRTEVEQLHKIFKLCGTPPDDYWNKSKLPLATMFKPHYSYENSLGERCKQIPETAFNLIDTLLSVEPSRRGSAKSALESEYFKTKPYACDPSSLPKYSPNKEINSKGHEEKRRKKPSNIIQGSEASKNPTKARKTFQEQTFLGKVGPTEVNIDAFITSRNNGARRSRGFVNSHGCSKTWREAVLKFTQNTEEKSQSGGICALPLQSKSTASNGSFVWAGTRWKHGGFLTGNGAAVVVPPGNGESMSSVWSGFRNCRLKSVDRNQPFSFDSSKVHNSHDDDEEETFFDAHSPC